MNVKGFEKKEKNTAELTVEIAADQFEEAINAAYKKNRNKIMIPGFRKGKAPRKIIENMYGTSVFYEDAVEALYPEALEFAVESEKLRIVGRPGILDVDIADDKNVTIKYSLTLYPEVTLGEYKGLSAEKEEVQVLDSEVDAELETTRKRNARIQTAERSAQNGDTANIDYEGFLDGVPFGGGKGDGYNLVLGSGQFIPGFEEQVIGMSAGEEKEINVTFPEDYNPELAGKAVVFKVKVNEVKENLLPELDDEFAKDVSEFDTLEAYRESVREHLTEHKTEDADKAFKKTIMDKVVGNMQCDIPEAMVDERIDSTIQSYNYNLSSQGMNFDMYLQMMGMKLEDFRSSIRPAAESQLKADLALEKIAETEDFAVSEEDVAAEYKKIAERYKVDEETAKKAVDQEAVTNQIKVRLAEELVYSTATAEPKKEAPEETEDSAN